MTDSVYNPYFARWCEVYGHDPDALVQPREEIDEDQVCVFDPEESKTSKETS